LEKDRLEYLATSRAQRIEELQSENERLLNWSNGGDAGVALPSLVRIVGDGSASTRQRLKAASAILAFQVQDDGVVEFTKRYLESVCTSTDIGNIDHKVEAAELLRRHEAPRIAPETVRPTYRDEAPKEPPEPLMQLVARRKAGQEQREREAIERLRHVPSEEPQLLALLASQRRNGNGNPDDADSTDNTGD
jgi:hypothetical protein